MKKLLLLVVAVMMGLLISCVPFTYDQCKTKMEKKGYDITTSDLAAGILKTICGITVEEYVICKKTVEDEDGNKTTYTVNALLFTSNEDAESAAGSANDWISKFGDYDEIQYSGKWVFFGDEEAIKDFTALI